MNRLSASSRSPQDDQPMNVLLFSSEYGTQMKGGLGTHVMELARGLSRADVHVTVLVYTMEAARIIADGAVTAHFVPVSATHFNSRHASMSDEVVAVNDALMAYARTLFAQDEHLPDLIHCHDWYFFPAARTLAQELGVPVVATVHMLHEPVVRFWGVPLDPEIARREQAMCLGADAVITVSHSMRELIQATHATPGERLYVVYNGLDPQPFLKGSWKPAQVATLRRSVAGPDERVILFAGRLDRQKGISALFAAAARVLAAVPNVRYLVVGAAHTRHDAQMQQVLVEEYKALDVKVKLLGAVTRKQLSLLYQLADIALVPSLYEPFGYAAVEPMAAGVPVIATDVGGLAEIVEHNRTGLLVPVHTDSAGLRSVDIELFAAAQIRLLSDPALAQQLGQAGRERALQMFGLDHMVAATMQVYRQSLISYRAR
jgi:glycosyltransferase involved in cell wall biosynthesis